MSTSLFAPLFCAVLAVGPTQGTPNPTDSETSAKDGYTLAYKFEKGQSVYYHVLQKTMRQSQIPGQQQVVRERVMEKKHYRVVAVRDDGSFVLETVFDQVQMDASFGDDKKVSFDSLKPKSQDPPGFGTFRRMTAKPQYQVHFEPNGKLKSVRRLYATKAGKESSKGHSYLVVFPDRPLRVGETWREEYPIKLPLSKDIMRKIVILRTYRLNSVEDGIAEISFASSLQSKVIDPAMLARLSQSTPSGSIRFDTEAGQIVSRSLKSDKTILNALGPKTLVRTVNNRNEKRITKADLKTAATAAAVRKTVSTK